MTTGTTITKFSTNTFDETLAQYGDISYIFHFLDLNTGYDDIITSIPVNTTVVIDDFVLPAPSAETVSNASASTTFDIIARTNESLFDMSLRYYGDISNVLQLIIDNSTIDNINTTPYGKLIRINNSNNFNQNVIFYNKMNSRLTTGTFTRRAFNRSFSLAFN